MATSVTADFLLNFADSLAETEKFKQDVIAKMQELQGGSAEQWSQFADAAQREFKRAEEQGKLSLRAIKLGFSELQGTFDSMNKDLHYLSDGTMRVADETTSAIGKTVEAYKQGGTYFAVFVGLLETAKIAVHE